MSINISRSMSGEFHEGAVDRTYIQLTPDRTAVENPPIERLTWPTYANVGRWKDDPHIEGHLRRAALPHEIKTSNDSDQRF